jgi:hypothetical protein
MVLNLLKYVIMKNITYIATALLVSVGSSSASLWVDFNSNQAGGGAPVSGNPADATNAAHNDSAYQSYHAAHENAAGFVTATYSTSFANTGFSRVLAAVTGTMPSIPTLVPIVSNSFVTGSVSMPALIAAEMVTLTGPPEHRPLLS